LTFDHVSIKVAKVLSRAKAFGKVFCAVFLLMWRFWLRYVVTLPYGDVEAGAPAMPTGSSKDFACAKTSYQLGSG
jgi:hypothetical protein